MNLDYRDGALHADGVALEAIAQRWGTPSYVYSRRTLEDNWRAYDEALAARPHHVCYAVKANDNLSLLSILNDLGSSFDIVSGGELERLQAVGVDPARVVFSGVGKTRAEIAQAVSAGVGCINLESADELARVAAAAQRVGRPAAVAVRVNPDVDAGTHPYISTGLRENKFGVDATQARAMFRDIAASPWLEAQAIACHIGSQLVSDAPVRDALTEVVALAEDLRTQGIELARIDCGGGLGIRYADEEPPAIGAFCRGILEVVPPRYAVAVEPGRSLIGPAGLLLMTVEYVKQAAAKRFIIVDAAMNDLLRPTLYDAWHEVLPCREAARTGGAPADIVGPVCESGDWLARDRGLDAVPGDCLALLDSGAYGAVMASNYNARGRPPAVLVDQGEARLLRARESVRDTMALELPYLSA